MLLTCNPSNGGWPAGSIKSDTAANRSLSLNGSWAIKIAWAMRYFGDHDRSEVMHEFAIIVFLLVAFAISRLV